MNLQLTLEKYRFELRRPFIRGFFPINIQSALRIPRFRICKFSQPWIENSIFLFAVGNPQTQRAELNDMWIFNCLGVSAPNPHIVQGSIAQFRSRPLKACRRKGLSTSLFPGDTGPCLCSGAKFGWWSSGESAGVVL